MLMLFPYFVNIKNKNQEKTDYPTECFAIRGPKFNSTFEHSNKLLVT
jgi:hypothetical protein